MKRPNKKILRELATFDAGKKQELLQQLGVASEEEVSLKGLHNLLRSKHVNIEIRSNACSLIMANRNKKSVEVLFEAFNDENKFLVNGAMLALAVIRSNRALEFLIETLRSSPDEDKRRSAAYSLSGYQENERAANALIDALNNKNESSETRAQAAESLGAIVAVRAVETLLANLHDPSLEVRFECIYALGQVGMDAAIIPELEKFLGDESTIYGWTVKEKASEAIKYIKSRVKALEKYTGDKSTADIWTLNAIAHEAEHSSAHSATTQWDG